MKKRGRPKLTNEPLVPVCVKLPVSLYDRLYAEARRAGASVPGLIRRRLGRRIRISKIDKRMPVRAS